MTDAELKLWQRIRLKQLGGFRFRRQHPLGAYIVDFICLEKRLIIEVDGGHHPDRTNYDQARTNWLESRGYRVLRFWNNEVDRHIDGVQQAIFEALALDPPPVSSPSRGEDRKRNTNAG